MKALWPQILPVITIGIYIAGIVYFRKRRAWLTYYLFSVFGLVLILVLGLQNSGLDKHIEFMELRLVGKIATLLKMQATTLSANTIHVKDSFGWIAMVMGIESSALIESSILIGLIGFYPAFHWSRKLRYLSIGLLLTMIFNVFRVLLIVSITHFYGRETIFFSHAIVGRLFFFAFIIILFWYILTRPTIDEVSKIIRGVDVD